MFSLIRRISHSVIPRPDRPWEDDPTSNAPNTRRKRRLSSTEPVVDADQEQTRKKKLRGESTELDLGVESSSLNGTAVVPSEDADGEAVHREGSLEVKDVTQGVKEVELEDKNTVDAPETHNDDKKTVEESNIDGSVAKPESIPLPDEEAGELDEPRSSSPPLTHSQPDSSVPATSDAELVDPALTKAVKKPAVAEDRGGQESATLYPLTPGRSSTRKTRSSPKKVTTTKA